MKQLLKISVDFSTFASLFQVKGIVDQAVKEMSIEKVLAEMEQTWGEVESKFESHHRTGIPLLVTDEELIETLEENQVCKIINLIENFYFLFPVKVDSHFDHDSPGVLSVLPVCPSYSEE